MAADLGLVQRLAAADRGLAVVAVARRDGSVQASVVNAGLLDHAVPEAGADGPFVAFVAQGAAAKVRLLRRQGRATIVFRSGWEWVSVEGPVHIIGPDPADRPRLPALLRAIFTAAGGTHDDWDTFDRVMAEQARVAILIQPERLTTNA